MISLKKLYERIIKEAEDGYEYDPQAVAIANATSRARGAVGASAVVPKIVMSMNPQGKTILDFGAGKDAAHAKALKDMGYDVTAYDFGSNVKDGIHDPGALSRQYDIVYASNVLNTQSSENMLATTISQIRRAMHPGSVGIFNLPTTPRKFPELTPKLVKAYLDKAFSSVEIIGGTLSD